MTQLLRFPLILSALIALLAAMWTGLIRLGWQLPPLDLNLPMLHGPLMVNGFLGVVIGLERAVALSAPNVKHRVYWPYLAPISVGLGTLVLFISGQPGALLIAIGSLVMVAAFIFIIRQHTALFTIMMGMGALSWFIGNVLWLLGQPIYTLILWWMGFPLFTIIGERLELSRILRLSKLSYWLFSLACGIFLIGAVVSLSNLDLGMRIAGLGEIACALWLFRYDIARKTLQKTGMPRYIALCLLTGYGWLGVSGAFNLYAGVTYAGPMYDAALHTVFVGFVFSMIFGHALIILPAVLGLPIRFDANLYVSLFLLHASLLLRVMGDTLLVIELRRWGGLMNEIALLLFLGTTVYTVAAARRASQTPTVAPATQSPANHR